MSLRSLLLSACSAVCRLLESVHNGEVHSRRLELLSPFRTQAGIDKQSVRPIQVAHLRQGMMTKLAAVGGHNHLLRSFQHPLLGFDQQGVAVEEERHCWGEQGEIVVVVVEGDIHLVVVEEGIAVVVDKEDKTFC